MTARAGIGMWVGAWAGGGSVGVRRSSCRDAHVFDSMRACSDRWEVGGHWQVGVVVDV